VKNHASSHGKIAGQNGPICGLMHSSGEIKEGAGFIKEEMNEHGKVARKPTQGPGKS
jgi:hypothetical protein